MTIWSIFRPKLFIGFKSVFRLGIFGEFHSYLLLPTGRDDKKETAEYWLEEQPNSPIVFALRLDLFLSVKFDTNQVALVFRREI